LGGHAQTPAVTALANEARRLVGALGGHGTAPEIKVLPLRPGPCDERGWIRDGGRPVNLGALQCRRTPCNLYSRPMVRLALVASSLLVLSGCDSGMCGNEILRAVDAPGGKLSSVLF